MSETEIDTAQNPAPRQAAEIASHDVATRAQKWVPPTPEELGKLIPLYRIDSLLGKGGMGAVYKAWQPALDRAVAIKLISADLAASDDFVVRFQREARTLARLQHPGIVAVHDFGHTSGGHLFFVMEYVDGTDLQHVLKAHRPTPEQTYELIAQICEALHYAHTQGVVHRDIKPANILLNKEGRAKVVDFGLARPLEVSDSDVTQAGAFMGTPAYMAPEQRVDAGKADQRADVFALGMMLYEMLTGHRPAAFPVTAPSAEVPVSSSIDAVVMKALALAPELRYQDVSELHTDVYRVHTQVLYPVPVAEFPAQLPPARAGRGLPKWLVVGPIVIALSAAGGFVIVKNKLLPVAPAPLAMSASPTPATVAPTARPVTQKSLNIAAKREAKAAALRQATPTALPKPAATATPPVVVRITPAPTPVPTPVPSLPGNDTALFEKTIRSYSWMNKQGWIFRFADNHILTVMKPGPDGAYHYWIMGPRKVHVQHAGLPATYDPNVGETWVFDQEVKSYKLLDHVGQGTRNHFLPNVARELGFTPTSP